MNLAGRTDRLCTGPRAADAEKASAARFCLPPICPRRPGGGETVRWPGADRPHGLPPLRGSPGAAQRCDAYQAGVSLSSLPVMAAPEAFRRSGRTMSLGTLLCVFARPFPWASAFSGTERRYLMDVYEVFKVPEGEKVLSSTAQKKRRRRFVSLRRPYCGIFSI